MEIWLNKMGLKGCKGSGLNAQSTQTPWTHPFWKLDIYPFSIIGLWGNNKWAATINMCQMEKYQNKMDLKGCKWSSLNAQGTQTPCSH